MGYSNHQIMVEVNKYKNAKDYRMAFEHKNDSTSKIWPDNTTLFAESASHYFENPETYLPSFKLALKNYTDKNFNAKLDFLVIYKPTFMGNLFNLKSKIILENNSFLIVKL